MPFKKFKSQPCARQAEFKGQTAEIKFRE